MTIKVCVAGATGWVGKPLCRAVAAANDLRLVGAVARTHAGADLQAVNGDPGLDVVISGSVAAIARGVHVVIGTSGLTDADYAEIDTAAKAQGVGVIAAGNFAITAVLLQRFACEAAKYLEQWEIIDYASDAKPDAPSGTVRELAFRLGEIKHPQPTIPIDQTLGERGTRGATLNGSQVHSLRLPGYVIAVEVIFGANDERLTIRHDAGAGAEPYIAGTLLAVRKVREHTGLVRGLDRIMAE
jgi:4-hydroxy-tetrahydrodipicolinate reductase